VSTPVVSVLMTAYNREKYIADAIRSVLASSLTDFELIVVDDCSSDRTVAVAREFEAKDRRVRVEVNPVNLGDYPNRNRAAALANGHYLKYVDSDDIIYPHGLAMMVECMEKFPEAGLGLQRPPQPDVPYPIALTPHEAYREHFLSSGSLFAEGPIALIFRTDKFREVGGFSGRRFIGDTEFCLKMGARYPTVKMPFGLVWWRSHGEQEIVLGQVATGYPIMNYQVNVDSLASPENPLASAERVTALRRVRKTHARFVCSTAIRRCRIRDAFIIMRETEFGPMEVIRNLFVK
jgi:glycosyltransferase involved in cell wall biosynthesis